MDKITIDAEDVHCAIYNYIADHIFTCSFIDQREVTGVIKREDGKYEIYITDCDKE